MNSSATTALARMARDILKLGVVTRVDPIKQTADVSILNNEYLGLKWLTGAASDDLIWNSPRKGSQVLVAALSGQLEHGIIIGSVFGTHKPAASKEMIDITSIEFADGTKLSYDKARHVLDIDGTKSSATINIKAKDVVINEGTKGGVICQQHIDLFTGKPRPSGAGFSSQHVKAGA